MCGNVEFSKGKHMKIIGINLRSHIFPTIGVSVSLNFFKSVGILDRGNLTEDICIISEQQNNIEYSIWSVM